MEILGFDLTARHPAVWWPVARDFADHITERAMTALAAAGVEIPYPKREVFLKPMNEAAT